MAFRIITDSAADLPPEIITQYGIEILPLSVYINEVEHSDGVDALPKDVLDKMRDGAKVKTAQVATHKFSEAFTRYAENGDSVLYIGFSSGLSGTVNAANIAKSAVLEKYPDFDITIIDTKCASMGFGLVVHKALVMQEKGASREEITEAVYFHSKHMKHVFTVDDLEYLYRGGRVSRASSFVGSLLSIKPVLYVDAEGRLNVHSKVKGRQNAIKKLAEMLFEQGHNLKGQIIGISHGDDLQAVEDFKTHMKEMAGCNNFMVSYIGCAIGAHSGPGTLAVFALDCESPFEKYFV